MQTGNNIFENLAKNFTEGNESIKIQVLNEIKENFDIFLSNEYHHFLQYFFKPFFNYLKNPPQLSENLEQKIRNNLLEIFNRLPNNELLKPLAGDLLKLMMNLLEIENEENCIICLRIIIDLHKNFRPLLESEVQPFLDFVQHLYSELPKTVNNIFSNVSNSSYNNNSLQSPTITDLNNSNNISSTTTSSSVTITTINNPPSPNIRSIHSFKVLTECPIIVVLLFQLYPRYLSLNVFKFIPLIVNTLKIQINNVNEAYITHKQQYIDFIGCQVKTLSFLAYLLRGYIEQLKNQNDIPKCVIQLLKNCPHESVSNRKELLVATRHILATEFRNGFLYFIDTLLEEKTLIGNGKTAYDTLRPLAYSTLADLIHHVRTELSLTQLSKVIFLYSRNIHDSSLPFTIQTMSAKLLLNLVEGIYRKNDLEGKGKILLFKILDTFVNKFSSLKKQIPKLFINKQTQNYKSSENIKDCKILVKTLVVGLKNIFWGISSCNNAANRTNQISSINQGNKVILNIEESSLCCKLLKNGLKCFSLYKEPNQQEEKEILDNFAAVFTMIEPRIFYDVFNMQIPFLFQRILQNQAMLTIPQHFLANPGVSKIFADILLNFLIERMKDLSENDKTCSSVLLRLFKLDFGSVTLFAENEPVLQPHLATIITMAMKCATEVKEPINYFILLRSLFRSIGGGKFDLFFKDFVPLLPSLLEGLNKFQSSSHPQSMKDLFVELSLTIPVRLSALLPCLNLLMKPLVLALESNTSELVIQGLRTLELCIDTLNPEFLDMFLEEIKPELMTALWKHLKSSQSIHGAQTARILGKLGGRNRQFLLYPSKLKMEENYDENKLQVITEFQSSDIINGPIISLNRCISLMKQKLIFSSDIDFKKQIFIFFKTCLNILLKISINKLQKNMDIDNNDNMKKNLELEFPRQQLKDLLTSIIMIHSNEKLQEFINPYFENVCQHFSILFYLNNRKKEPNENYHILIECDIFIDSLIENITHENPNFSKSAIRAIDILIETCILLNNGSLEIVSSYEEFAILAKRICDCCYRPEWFFKHGGCLCIGYLTQKLSHNWVKKYQLLFVKSLLFILKDLSPELSVSTIEEASANLMKVINISNHFLNYQIDNNKIIPESLKSLVSLLISELSSSHYSVRTNVQKSLELISQLTKIEITKLLQLSISNLIDPIFDKPLRSLPIVVQTGYIDALTYCLNLKPPALSFTPELQKVLQGALQIADKDDFTSNKPTMQKNVHQLNTLKVVSIELLSAAMACSEFQTVQFQEFRNSIIGMFFKALTSRTKEIVNVAKKGLQQVIQQQKLPKELLQSSLRPVLLNFADHRKLTTPLLQGLTRLLELLTNCFNITLGDKLSEHLNKWTESIKQWKDSEQIKISASILEIFHLLPPAACKFLDSLVSSTIQLETHLSREICSPYRIPLIKFLNRYPVESIDYFLQRLQQPSYSKLFRFLIQEEIAKDLRDELARSPQKLIDATFRSNIGINFLLEAQFQGIFIVRTLVKFLPEWLSKQRSIIDCLIEIWNTPGLLLKLNSEESLPLYFVHEPKLILECFLNYFNCNREEIDLLFYMPSIFAIKTTVDYNFLKDFYLNEISEKSSPLEKKNIFIKFLQFFKDPTFTNDHKVQVFQVLITPMISAAFNKNEYKEILCDPQIISSIIKDILDPNAKLYEEPLNIELLQFANLLVRFMPNELSEQRKDLIKFAWNHLKSEDITTRHHAYILICRFIDAYDTPPKIVLQVYIALIRSPQAEVKNLIKQALDILTPALQKRFSQGSIDSNFPAWIRYTKKIINEEGHSLPQLIHILQLIVRHPQPFYPVRGSFISQMINCLPRVGLIPNSPHENRKLAIDICELIINWEKQKIKEDEQKNDNNNNLMEIDLNKEGALSKKEFIEKKNNENNQSVTSEFQINAIIANFLVRITSDLLIQQSQQSIQNSSNIEATGILANRALSLLKDCFSLWSNMTIKFAYIEKLLSSSNDQINLIYAGLNILNVILDNQPRKFILENITQIQNKFTLSLLNNNNSKIISSLCLFFSKILKTFPLNQPNNEISLFYNQIGESIEFILNNYEKNNLNNAITILKTYYSENAEYIDRYLPSLIKLLQKLVKDFTKEILDIPSMMTNATSLPTNINITPSSSTNISSISQTEHLNRISMNNSNKKIQKDSSIFFHLIHLLEKRFEQISKENRLIFFESLNILIEKSTEIELLNKISNIIRDWILNINNENIITTKDKITFLHKMTKFEQMSNPFLQNTFLELVYHIYNDPSTLNNLSKSDLSQLDIGFMMGLRYKDGGIRNKFFDILNKNINRLSVVERLKYIFSIHNWELMGSTFWIKQALDLIFFLISKEKPIKLASFPYEFNITSLINSEIFNQSIDNEFFMKLSKQNNEFISELNNLKQEDLFVPLRELIYQDNELVYYLWVTIFPQLWSNLSVEEKDKLNNQLISFLTKEYHLKQQRNQPNVIQAILESISFCEPLPNIPIELIKYLGKTYNAWHIAIYILEKGFFQNIYDNHFQLDISLAEIYQLLSEDDIYFSFWKKNCNLEDSKIGLTFEQFQLWKFAQDTYKNVMIKVQEGIYKSEKLSITEINLWERHWINCAKRLGQWDLLADYARSTSSPDLVAECAWHLSDWNSMKEALNHSNISEYLDGKFYQGYLIIHEGKPQDAESIYNQLIQISLRYFQSLPDIPSSVHIPVLQNFQKIIELKESFQIVKEINMPNKIQSIPEVKKILLTWRDRLPNKWDDILIWDNILLWRQLHVFSHINSAYANLSEPNNSSIIYIGHHETAWTINKFSNIARKHQLIELCLTSLNKIYSLPNIEIQDAFIKLKEQIKCYMQLPTHYKTGLDIINSTNLDYFIPYQKAEFFKLKAELLSKMGQNEEAYSTFSNCISISDNLYKGWLSWGIFCDNQFMSKKDIFLADYTIHCYIHAIHSNPVSNRCRKTISRILWLINFYDDENEKLLNTFENQAELIPLWVWLSWIPSLLNCLSQPEANQMKNILIKLATLYPQAIFYHLKAFIIEKQEMNNLINQSSAMKYAEEIMNSLKTSHNSLISDLEFMVQEISSFLIPDSYSLLFQILKNLLFNTYEIYLSSTNNEITPEFHENLVNIIQLNLFKHHDKEFFNEFKPLLEKDLLNETKLSNLIEILKNWLEKLKILVENKFGDNNKIIYLQDICPSLIEFQNGIIEIPGQYSQDREPQPDHHIRLDRFHCEIYISEERNRFIQLRGSNGKIFKFEVQVLINLQFQLKFEERLMKLLSFFSDFIYKFKESRRRNLFMNILSFIPLSSNIRLVEINNNYISMEQIYSEYCQKIQKDIFFPLDFYKQNILTMEKLELYNRISQDIPDNLLLKYVKQIIPSYSNLFIFKKQFINQYSSISLISYIMLGKSKNLFNIKFSKNTGSIIFSNFFLEYNSKGLLIENHDNFPIRLTRNFQTFFNQIFIDSLINSSMTAISMCLANYKEEIFNYLCLFFKDELLSLWNFTPSQEEENIKKEIGDWKNKLKTAIETNVTTIIEKIQTLSPKISPHDKNIYNLLINQNINELILNAQNLQFISQINPIYFPWF